MIKSLETRQQRYNSLVFATGKSQLIQGKTYDAQNFPLTTQSKSVPQVQINTASSATEILLQKIMGSIYHSRSTKVSWNNSVTHTQKSKSIRYKAFIKKEDELKGKCMNISLTYEHLQNQNLDICE